VSATPPAPRRWRGALVTAAAALVLTSFLVLVARLHFTSERLESSTAPDRALALIVERTMDLDDALARASALERQLYFLTLTDGGGSLAQAIEWYEELSNATAGDVLVDFRLAILRGEAGRLGEVQDAVADWETRGDLGLAEVVAAAYLAAPVEPRWPARQAVERLVDGGWFHDRLALRLAPRTGDTEWLAETREAARARIEPLLRLIRGFAAGEAALLVLGVVAAVLLARARRRRVAAAPLPPPWRGREGLLVLVRGGAGGVLVTVALLALAGVTDRAAAAVDAMSLPLMYVPLLVLARRRLLAPAGLGFGRGFGLGPDRYGWLPLARTAGVLVAAGIAIDMALGLLSEAVGVPSHWTEWFDEDLAWGSWDVVTASLLGTVVSAPVLEEIVFRGLLYGTLRRRLAWPVAALLSAAVFAGAHGYGAAGFGSVFASGVMWAVAYEKTGSLLPGMAAHAANNVSAACAVLGLLRV
jgi:membrane protease YdiL (CAAX protease family)